MMKKITLTTLFLFFLYFFTFGKVYYTSPTGTETVLSKVTRDNPADWRHITQGEMARQLQCGDSVLLRWDQGIYTEGTRIYASGCSDTYAGAIHYLSEPGGFAIFRIEKYPQNNSRHIDRKLNPDGIVVGGEVHWKTSNRTDPVSGWNTKGADQSEVGRYVWIREIIMQGNFGKSFPKRDLGSMNMPYGSTGARDPGTIAGSQNYDNMTGLISLRAYGGRLINCIFWNLGHSGIGVNSGLRKGNATFYGNVLTNIGHSGPEKDRFHSVYQQWQSNNRGRLIHKHSIVQFSAEEQLQLWAQSGIDPVTGESKVDKVDLIENVLINGGTLSGKNHPHRISSNSKIGGYSYDNDIRLIGNISWHDQGGSSWQSGYSLNLTNERRNFYFKDNLLVGSGAIFRNVKSIKEVSSNTFVALDGKQISFEVNVNHEGEALSGARKWNNNAFYGGGNVHYSRWDHDKARRSYDKISFKAWQNKGFDKNSSYSEELPGDMIKYFSNEYLQYYDTDWRGHVVILNFSGQNKKYIDVSKFGLNEGDKFRVIDVQNIAGDLTSKYLYEGLYSGSNGFVEIDMINHNDNNVVKDPTGEMVGPFGTDKRFGTYLIVRVERGSQKVNEMPVADAGEDQKITLPKNSIVIDASASEDPDGDITAYSCEKASGPDSFKIDDSDTDQPKISELSEGVYTFKVTVTDNNGASASDEVKITVDPGKPENQDPIADAGPNKTITLPNNTIILDGSDSDDGDGDIEKYEWTKLSGPSPIDIDGDDTHQLVLSDLKEGSYKFKLTVTDDQGGSSSDEVALTVKPEEIPENQDPTADAGPNKTITLPNNTIILDGSDSDDGDGDIEKYEWTKLSGPSPIDIDGDDTHQLVLSDLKEGSYKFKLTVTDDRGGSSSDEVALTVKPEEIPDQGQQGNEDPVQEPSQKTISFTLINADTDQPIAAFDPIPEQAVINLYDLPTKNLNIRANTDPLKVGSVMFTYDGKENFHTENVTPFALYSDNNGNYKAWTPGTGNHTVSATPFSGKNRTGEKGQVLTINFVVIDEAPPVEEEPVEEEPEEEPEEEEEPAEEEPQNPGAGEDPEPAHKVISFTLINADTDKPIAAFDPIPEQAEINLYDLPTKNLNIRANTNSSPVGSVMFSYGGKENFRTENVTPFALYSDNNGNYQAWKPNTGSHTVVATPFSAKNRGGEKGSALTLNFTVIDQAPPVEEEPVEEPEVEEPAHKVVSFTLINADTDKPIAAYDPIPEGSTINLQALPTLNLNIRANTDPYKVGSVMFSYDDQLNFKTENVVPYALNSDKNGDYIAWRPALGSHTVTATPYSHKNRGGEVGKPLALNFTIESYIPSGAKSGEVRKYMIYPNPNKGVFDLEPVNKDIKIISVAVYDSFGNKVYDKDYNKYFDVEHFALGLVKSGLYKFIITTEKSIDYQTMIVEF